MPLSTPGEGRTGAVEALAGEDRCDPEQRGAAGAVNCAEVIETRAAEFPSPEPARLSPEQRLLGEQRVQSVATAEAAARRLAVNNADPNSIEDQSIAAVVLQNRPTQERPPDDEPVTESSPVIEAIVGAITANGPRSP